MKNILFLVTGKTPQIITETVWALACDPENDDKWIPDEIQILTTTDGIKEVKDTLLGNTGIFQKMRDEYQLPLIQFDESNLHTITDDNNKPLEDLKTPSDNECAANAICEKIRDLTKNDNTCLYVSIAGGRKTMGFYAGYALSLYGRAQDRMSHVLVSSDFETLRGFFYPAPKPQHTIVKTHKKIPNNSETFEVIELDTFNAKVWLANIPFVRMRDAIKEKHQLKSHDSFSDVISKINDSFKNVQLTIRLDNNSIIVNDKYPITDLPPREFSLLHWFANLRKNGKDGIVAPKIDANSTKAKPEDAEYVQALTQEFLPYYEDLKNIEDKELVVDKKFFESVKSHLKTSLEEKLGLELAAKIAIKQEKKGMPFYLDLTPDSIQIVDKFQN